MVNQHNKNSQYYPQEPGFTYDDGGTSAPPRLLLFVVIGGFFLLIAGILFGIFAFNNILQPAQQERVVNELPFMEAVLFRAPTPAGGVIPTSAVTVDTSDLLSLQIGNDKEETSTPFPVITTETTIPPTGTPDATATILPTNTPTSVPTLIPTATEAPAQSNIPADTVSVASSQVVPGSGRMYGFAWERQSWNNCGPATVTSALSFYGWQENQSYAKNILKPNREDKNVSPHELAEFVNEYTGVRAMVRMGGSLDTLKLLIANNFPVIIERGIKFEANDWLGHYQSLVAYSDNEGTFFAYDTWLGTGDFEQGVTVPYREMDEGWRQFNRIFIVLYQQSETGKLQSILGNLYDEQKSAEIAFETAQAEGRTNPQDGHAWFNMGTSLVKMAQLTTDTTEREQFYQQAANAYNRAVNTGELPWRMHWYQFGPFEAYYVTGRYDDVLSLVQSNLNQSPELEESYYWRGRVYLAQNNSAQAASEFRTALSYNPNFEAARTALDNLSG